MKSNKYQAPVDVWLVGKDDQEIPPSGDMVGSGTALNLADGQLGVISTDHEGTVAYGRFIPAGTTGVQVDSIKVVQGTPNSSATYRANAFSNNDKAYVQSHKLLAGKILSVATKKYEVDAYNMFRIKTLTSVAVDTTYKATLNFGGARKDITYNFNGDVVSATVTTPTVAPTNINDYVLQELALKLNRESLVTAQAAPSYFSGNKQFVVFGVNIGGSTGTVIGTLTAGTTFNFAQYTVDGSTVTATYTADTTFINSLNKAIAEDAALSTARIVTLGSVASGTAATINALLVVALDEEELQAFDDVRQLKIRITGAGISGQSAAGVPIAYVGGEVSPPFEGANNSRQVVLNYRSRAGLQTFSPQNHPVNGEYYIVAPEYVFRTAEGYTVTKIVHFGNTENLTNVSVSPMETTIVLEASITNPSADADTGYTTATDDSATVSDLNATLGAWLSSVDDAYNNIEYKGDASKSTPFV